MRWRPRTGRGERVARINPSLRGAQRRSNPEHVGHEALRRPFPGLLRFARNDEFGLLASMSKAEGLSAPLLERRQAASTEITPGTALSAPATCGVAR